MAKTKAKKLNAPLVVKILSSILIFRQPSHPMEIRPTIPGVSNHCDNRKKSQMPLSGFTTKKERCYMKLKDLIMNGTDDSVENCFLQTRITTPLMLTWLIPGLCTKEW